MRSLEEVHVLFAERGYNLLDTEYHNNKQYLTFEKGGYKYYNTYNGFQKTSNPKKWGQTNPYSIDNLRVWLKNEQADIIVPEQEYNYDNLLLICSCGREYNVKWDNFLRTKQFQCPECGKARSAVNHIKSEYFDIMQERQLTPLGEYQGCGANAYYKTKEGYIVKTSLYGVKHGNNEYDTLFDVCNEYTMDNICLFAKLRNDGTKFLSEKYIGSKHRYLFQCACGEQFETAWDAYISGTKTKCEHCTHFASTLAKKTESWFKENHVKYIKEKTYHDCKYKGHLRFDYYLPEMGKIVEIDGNQHEKPVRFGGMSIEEATKAFEETKIRDNIKNEYCAKNNIPLLRIKQSEFKTDVYKNKLKTFTS